MKNIFLKRCAGITAFLILATQLTFPTYATEIVSSTSNTAVTTNSSTSTCTDGTTSSTSSCAVTTSNTPTTTSTGAVDATSAINTVTSSVENNTEDSTVESTVNSTADAVVNTLDTTSESTLATDVGGYEKSINDKIKKLTDEAKKDPKKRAKLLREIMHLKQLLMKLRVKAIEKNKKVVDKIKKIIHRKAVYEIRWGNLTGRRQMCKRISEKYLKESLDDNEVPRECLSGVPKSEYKGKISVNVGTLKIHKKVLFEKNDKVVVESGPSVGFESVIAGHWDGLIVEYIPPTTTSVTANTNKELEVTISIGDLNKTYKGSEMFGRKKIDQYHMIEIKPLLRSLPGVTAANTSNLVAHKVKVQDRLNDLREKLDRLRILGKGDSTFALDEVEKVIDDVTNYNFDDTSSTTVQAEIDKLTKELTDDINSADATKKAAALKKKINELKKVSKLRKFTKQLIPFKDTDDSEWYTKYVSAVKNRGIVSGYKDKHGNEIGEFRPANNVTVAEILKIGLETSVKGESKDSNKIPVLRAAVNHWAKGYVLKGEELGLDLVKNAKSLDRPATRGEVIRMMLEALDIKPGKVNKTDFTDVSASNPSAPYIQYAKSLGIVSGDDGKGTFRPNAPINRAEVSKIADLVNSIIIGGWDS